MSRYFFLYIITAGFLLASCQSANETDSGKDQEETKTTVLNEAFVKELGFPPSVLYLGLEKPTDTTVSTPTKIDAPNGMLYVKGGIVQIGSDDGHQHERPSFWAKVAPFLWTNIPSP